MATPQPSNHNVPESISFLVLLNELQRRSFPSANKHAEREQLWEELVQREHSLEQNVLRQLERSYNRNQSWWKKIWNGLLSRLNRISYGTILPDITTTTADRDGHHKVGEPD